MHDGRLGVAAGGNYFDLHILPTLTWPMKRSHVPYWQCPGQPALCELGQGINLNRLLFVAYDASDSTLFATSDRQ
jgi:hypothetical protein